MSTAKEPVKFISHGGDPGNWIAYSPTVDKLAEAGGKPLKYRSAAFVLSSTLLLLGCATVHQEDLQAWQGAPVAALDTHPIFVTMPPVRTRTSEGVEIRNYVSGRAIASCSGGGSTLVHSSINLATYNRFMSCMQTFAACNNIFYIKGGYVQQYTPIGTGGGRCYTDERLRPGFSGTTNVQ